MGAVKIQNCLFTAISATGEAAAYFSLLLIYPPPSNPNAVELRIGSDSYGLQNPPSPPFVKGGNSMESLQIIPLS